MKVLVITTVFTCLAALFVAIRLLVRFRLVKSPGLDDALITAALVGHDRLYTFSPVVVSY